MNDVNDKRESLQKKFREWHDMPEEGNEAARLRAYEDLFDAAMKLFPWQQDAFGLFFEMDWDKYDPAKGDLYGFMSFRLKRRMADLGRQDAIGGSSLDAGIGGEDDFSLLDAAPGDADVDDSALMIDETTLSVMTLMLDMKSRMGGRAGNPVKINYFRLFFTDGVVNAIQAGEAAEAFARRERDLFRVIKEPFLNFFMASPCARVADILASELKPYGEMVEGRPMEPPEQPLPNDVYTTYLERVEHYTAKAAAVSQQRTDYRAFMRANLSC